MDTKETELNRQLAEWAGFQWLEATDGNYHWFDANGDIVSPTDEDGNVIWGMDACFKHLVPKLPTNMGVTITKSGDRPTFYARIEGFYFDSKRVVVGNNESPALALCLAIEKLIDGEK